MTARRLHPATRHVALTLGAILAVLSLGACDLRLESAPPAVPTPGPAEQVRERTVADALALAAAARSARPTADGAAAAVLDDVASFSTAHAGQLGGAYRSGLPGPTDTPTPASSSPVATPDQVLGALRTDAATALTDAGAAEDGALARLVATVGVAREELAARLGAALGEPAPAATPAATPSVAPAPSPSPSAAGAPTPAASTGPVSALPGGLTPGDVTALVLAHDQAGFGLEVVAAKLTKEARAAAFSSAAAHRAAAEAWAQRAGIASTGTDPRRAAYGLPANVGDPDGARALAASLETGVADAAGAALAHASAGGRADLIGELRAAETAAVAWGAAPTAFPGLPGVG